MKNNGIEMRILIKGKPITEYAHNGLLFVEGRHSSNFEIELTNTTLSQVEAIVSVDGLSVIDGKDAGPNSSGYLLKGNETLRIPGWKLNDTAVAAFQFSGGKGQSYVEQSTGSASNKGVIGVLAYKEKQQAYRPVNYPTLQPFTGFTTVSPNWCGTTAGTGYIGGGFVVNGITLNCVSPAGGSSSMYSALAADAQAKGANSFACGSLDFNSTSIGASVPSDGVISSMACVQNLGTAFGKETEFATSTTTFQRGDLLMMSVVYYDDARGLKSRGIELVRRKSKVRADQPSAFPGMNCRPPVGWNG